MNEVKIAADVMNVRVLESLRSGGAAGVEKIATASGDMTRTQLRETSFAFQILPCTKASKEDLVPALSHDKPMIYWELEPDSPGSKWVPFQTVAEGEYIFGSRYVIPLARVMTKKYQKDLAELYTYKKDLRKVLTDNSIKDGLSEIDGKFIQLCNEVVDDATASGADFIQNHTGKVQHMTFADGITKNNLVDAKKMMLQGSTFTGMEDKFVLQNHVCLMNSVTAQDFAKIDHDKIGDTNVEKAWKDGVTTERILGMKFIYTIKASLVPNDTVYFFAAPDFLGKCFYLEDWTMYMKKEAFNIEMFSYWLGGMAIGNVAGVCKATFNAT